MGVAIALAITESITIAVGVAKVTGHVQTGAGSHMFDRFKNADRAVALVGVRQIKGCLGQGIEAFRQSDALEGRGAGFHHHHRLGVCQANVFSSRDQHAPENEAGIFSCFHHASEPEQGRIGVRSTQ